jgi:hypothetical protein
MANPIFKVLDPRMDLSKPTTYAIEDGARLVNFEVSNTSSAGSGGSSLTWTNADPPGPGVVVDKKIIVSITYRITLKRKSDGTDAGQPVIGYEPLPGFAYPTDQVRALGTDGPRFLPIAQTTNVCNVIINNASANGQLYDYIDPLMRYTADRNYCETQLSLAPSQQDQYQAYGDFLSSGAARNVLGDYGENSYESNRGGYPLVYIEKNELSTGVLNSFTEAIVWLTSYEPIFISPCDFGLENQRGFYGVDNFRVTINTTGDLSRVWCHNADPTKGGWPLYSVDAIIAGANNISPQNITYTCGISTGLPALYFTYLSPKILDKTPEFNVYPYYYLDDQVFEDVKLVTAGGTATYKTNSFNLDSVPKYLYVFIRRSNQTRKYFDTDSYAFINNLSITFANNPNQLSNAQPNQLYSMSVKNGCKLSWTQWSKYVGSVICVDFSQDISLPDDMFVGMRNPNAQLSVQARWTNISDEDISFSMYCIPSYVGIFDITAGQAQAMSGIVSLSDYINAPDVHTLDYVDAHNFYGGNFFSKVRDISSRALPRIKQAAQFAKDIAPTVAPLVGKYGPSILQGAEILGMLLGAGFSKQQANKMISDGSYIHVLKGQKKLGKAKKKGGAALSKKRMNETLLSRAIGY